MSPPSPPETCWNCDAALPSDAVFCGACGQPARRCPECDAPVPRQAPACPACDAPTASCERCGAVMRPTAKFCGSCGAPTPGHATAEVRRYREKVGDRQRAVRAMGAVFALVLAGLVLASWLVGTGIEDEDGDGVSVWIPTAAELLLVFGFDTLTGIVGVMILGWSCLRRTFGGAPETKYLALALLAVVPSLGFAWLYLGAIGPLFADFATIEIPPVPMTMLGLCVMPALMEEWLCRGVLWEAARRVGGHTTMVVSTATLFAMMHGLGGGFVLEFPHRFVTGLLLGWLRLKSGSLAPSMLAHFVHNLLAITATP